MLNVLVFLVLLMIQRFVHESGHFLMARKTGVAVDEFGIGYRPRIIELANQRGTAYTLNFILLGFFVKMKAEKDRSVSDGFAGQPKRTRLAILSMGPILSITTLVIFLLPTVLLFTLVFTSGVPETVTRINPETGESLPAGVLIVQVDPDSPAALAGLMQGDIIWGADDVGFNTLSDLRAYVYENLGNQIVLHVEREGQISDVAIVPRQNPSDDQGAIGILMQPRTEIVSYPFPQAFARGVDLTIQQITMLLGMPFRVISGQLPVASALPQAEANRQYVNMVGSSVIDHEPVQLFALLGMGSSVLLAPVVVVTLISLLPFPGWDTWRILALLFEQTNTG